MPRRRRLEQLADVDAERAREPHEHVDSDVVASFDAANIARIDAHAICEIFLREPSRATQFDHA